MNGFEAPRHVLWTRTGGAGLVRVPANRPSREAAARIELRSPDPGTNPYLSLAAIFATSPGFRNVLAPTRRPRRTFVVTFAHAARVV